MCKEEEKVKMMVPDPAELKTGKIRWNYEPIDICITPLVQALNNAGIYTVDSCCGHGKELGHISLHDGRTIVILSKMTNEEVDRVIHIKDF